MTQQKQQTDINSLTEQNKTLLTLQKTITELRQTQETYTQQNQQTDINSLTEQNKTLLTLQNTITELRQTQETQLEQINKLTETLQNTITEQGQTIQKQQEQINQLSDNVKVNSDIVRDYVTDYNDQQDLISQLVTNYDTQYKRINTDIEANDERITKLAIHSEDITINHNKMTDNVSDIIKSINAGEDAKKLDAHINQTSNVMGRQSELNKNIVTKINESITYQKTLTTDILPKLIYHAKTSNFKSTFTQLKTKVTDIYNEHNITLLDVEDFETLSESEEEEQS